MTQVPDRVLDELIALRQSALAAQQAFADVLEAAAEKHEVAKPALRRYVNAAAADKLEKLRDEAEALQLMLFPDGVDVVRQATVTLQRAAA